LSKGGFILAVIHNVLRIEISPTVQDVCEVITAVSAYYPNQEEQVLKGIQDAINKRLKAIAPET